MLFNSIEYGFLLTVAFALFWLLAGHRRARVLVLLAASYLFYASWNVKYLSLIFLSSSMDFAIGRALTRTDRTALRRLLLATSVIVNLGILCTFKYFNFFAHELTATLGALGIRVSAPHLSLLLPVGISFYTFQTLSYTIDVFRRRMPAADRYFEYLLFVSFFPQLVAGPIVRAAHLIPQIARPPVLDAGRGSRALLLIAIGLAKKIAIADLLGVHLVDPVFSNPVMYSSLETLAAVYGYAFQIYADFSAYSDIAIGSAALLGFDIPINFDAPYRAADLREFWRRWHISLSTWLRDYLYIPLGGSKKGPTRTQVNLLATMLLGGLWHGAAMTFVAWGAIHGVALVVTRLLQRLRRDRPPLSGPGRAIAVFATFHVVCAAWIFFRARDFGQAAAVFEALLGGGAGVANIPPPALFALAAATITHWLPAGWMQRLERVARWLPAPAQAAAMVGLLLALDRIASTEVTPFIYFQF